VLRALAFHHCRRDATSAPAELIADKGYHSRDALKALDGGPWKWHISEPRHDQFLRWQGDHAARRAP
jgi:transposase